jgi:Transglutaminase-like superfamily
VRGWRRHVRGGREAVLCVRIAGAIPLIWLGVHLWPLPEAMGWLTPRRPSTRPLPPERILHLAELLLDRSLFGIRATCLLRSLVLYRFLRESGVDVRLHLGVSSEKGTLSGHAWLTRNGHPWLESSDPGDRFVEVICFPKMDVNSD